MKKAKKGIKVLMVFAFSFILLLSQFSLVSNTQYSGVNNNFKTDVNIRSIFDSGRMVKEGETSGSSISQGSQSSLNTNSTTGNSVNTNTNGNVNTNSNQNEGKTELEIKKEEQKKKELEEAKIMPETSKTKLLTMKENSQKTVENYAKDYRNSPIYGTIAYILRIIQTLSIPLVILVLIASFVYQAVLGNSLREVYKKGQNLRTNALIFLAAAQVLPLVFAILVKGWGN